MSRLSFVFQEALRGLFFNKFMTFVVIVNIAISLYFVSIFLTSFLNLNKIIEQAESRVTLEVFLSEGKIDTSTIRSEIMSTPGISSVRYVSKEEAYDIFIKEIGSDIMVSIEGNPLPASYKCSIKAEYRNQEKLSIMRNSLKGILSVDDVSEIRGWVPVLQKIRRIFAGISLGVLVVLCLTIFFTVFSTIRLAYQSRHEHIRVMALVGASEFAIKVPFIISGGIQGFCGGALSATVLYFTIVFARRYLSTMYFDLRIVPFLMGLGLFLGILASFRSIPAEEHL